MKMCVLLQELSTYMAVTSYSVVIQAASTKVPKIVIDCRLCAVTLLARRRACDKMSDVGGVTIGNRMFPAANDSGDPRCKHSDSSQLL